MSFGISATALFLGGTALVGGYLASEGASDAADTAAQASGQASAASIAEQRRQYDLNRADHAPYLTLARARSIGLPPVAPGGEFGNHHAV
jgi:hypothetical protein